MMLEQGFDPAAVDGDAGAGDGAGALGGEERDERGKFVGTGEAADGNFGRPRFVDVRARNAGLARLAFGQLVEAFGKRVAGADVVDGNAGGAEFVGERFWGSRDG